MFHQFLFRHHVHEVPGNIGPEDEGTFGGSNLQERWGQMHDPAEAFLPPLSAKGPEYSLREGALKHRDFQHRRAAFFITKIASLRC